MGYDEITYLSTMDDSDGPLILPEPTEWYSVNSMSESEFVSEIHAPSPAVKAALLVNVVLLLSFLYWLLSLIF